MGNFPSFQVADLWVNCRELAAEWRDWLCREGDDADAEAEERRKSCAATCSCDGKIAN